jgi:hypothetical protein
MRAGKYNELVRKKKRGADCTVIFYREISCIFSVLQITKDPARQGQIARFYTSVQ